jgi:hypothetical protein
LTNNTHRWARWPKSLLAFTVYLLEERTSFFPIAAEFLAFCASFVIKKDVSLPFSNRSVYRFFVVFYPGLEGRNVTKNKYGDSG